MCRAAGDPACRKEAGRPVFQLASARPRGRGAGPGRAGRRGRGLSACTLGRATPPTLRPGKAVIAAATASSVMPKHEFSVDMACEGCSNAVTRVLNKLGGVQFDIDLPNKKVCIDSEHSVDTLLETLGKTGKAVSYLGPK
ncbi:copper transport protein ATOX1 [Equus quagga]|nr:copper transport protein ATOX1 [Equus quagga]